MIIGQQVHDAMIAADITRVDHHDCSICGYMTQFVRKGNDLFFDAGCGCTGGSYLQPRDWSNAADWINMQDRPEIKDRLASRFGLILPLPDPPE